LSGRRLREARGFKNEKLTPPEQIALTRRRKICGQSVWDFCKTGTRTVSVRSTFDDESNRRIFQVPPPPRAANRDGSRSGHFKLTRDCFVENFSLTPGFSRVRMVCAEKKTV
jgi:hypothetical protein